MQNRFTELLTLLEADEFRKLEVSGKRRDVLIEALRIAADSQLAPIQHASDVEKRIAGKLIVDLLAADYSITIYNGGDEAEITRSTDEAAIYEAMSATSSDEIVVGIGTRKEGWVRLIWGNEVDLISDYTTNLEKVLAGANALASELDK